MGGGGYPSPMLRIILSAMTFTFDSEVWFKVTAYNFPKSSVSVDWGKERECNGKRFLTWSYMTLTNELETSTKGTLWLHR